MSATTGADMTFRWLRLIVLIAGSTAWRPSGACLAQEVEQDAPQQQNETRWHSHSRQVLVENCNLELSVINMVEAAQDESEASSAPEGLPVRWSLQRPGTHISPQVEICTLTADWKGPPNADEKSLYAWNMARTNAEAALRGVQGAAVASRDDDINRQVAELQKQVRDYKNQLDDVRRKTEALSGPYSEQFTRVQFDAAASKLQELALERVGLAARREAIEARIDALRELDDQDARDDPVIAELRKLVDIREEQFANLKALNETGQASGISMRNAQAEVAQARIEMLRARRSAAEVANGPLIRELNNELSRLIIRDAELKATHDALDERTEKLEELIAAADQRALLTQQSDALRNVIGVLEDKMRQLRNEANQPRGPITIKPLAEALPKPQR
jgi:hypothetical protein